jgi:butyrate kinase
MVTRVNESHCFKPHNPVYLPGLSSVPKKQKVRGEVLPQADFAVLTINPGSTSTKVAVYAGDDVLLSRTLRHSDAEMQIFKGKPAMAQLEFRSSAIRRELSHAGISLTSLHAVVGRGGLLGPVTSGTYRITEPMLDELRTAKYGDHPANLGAILAKDIAEEAKIEAFIVDPPTVDEWQEVARLSGSSLMERACWGHVLNTKAIARRYAADCGKPYAELRLLIAHLGSGVTVSAHEHGRMIDSTAVQEGAFSADRTGELPVIKLARLCYSGQYSLEKMTRLLFGEGGLYSYLGTRDLQEVERRIAEGDSFAALVYNAMVYQIAKVIGSISTVLHGKVDALLITGGMAHSERLMAALLPSVSWIAPVRIYPGEDELKAMAEGALRVLRRQEVAREYRGEEKHPPVVAASNENQ